MLRILPPHKALEIPALHFSSTVLYQTSNNYQNRFWLFYIYQQPQRIPLTYYDEYWDVNFIYDYDYIIEEVPYKKHIYEKVSIKPYVKRFSISNRRKFAKNRTNKIIRHTKLNTLASNPAYYRRVFDYAYEIW